MDISLKTENFCLSLQLQVFWDDIRYPSNSIMHVSVVSGDFRGAASMDIDVKAFSVFAADLKQLCLRLHGEARLAEPFGTQNRLSFQGDGRGHIRVTGTLCDMGQILTFDNSFDQTSLCAFADAVTQAAETYPAQQGRS